MIWQPALPKPYLDMSEQDLADRIAARRAELGDRLVILGHHYQVDEIIRHADITGDSLKLSQRAAALAADREALRWVVFCGVHFMAETADMLTPEHVDVILPDLSAGCSMADMAGYEDTVDAWDAMHAVLAAAGWQGRIIPVTYVNSSAAIKAFVGAHGGACCTSSNAERVFDWALRGGTRPATPDEDIKVLFLPDQHLGRNTAAHAGIDVAAAAPLYDPRRTARGEPLGGMTADQLLHARVVLWAGHCSVHKLFRPEHVTQIRDADHAAAADEPARAPTRVIVHPECCKEVVDLADDWGSTEKIIRTIEAAPPGSRWAVGTEVHLVNRLAARAAERGVSVRILSDCQCLCTTMYRIDQPHLAWILDGLTGRGTDAGRTAERIIRDDIERPSGEPVARNIVRVHPEVRGPALDAVDRMLALSEPAAAMG